MISSNTDFDTEVTLETTSRHLPEDSPFRILMLGDWSGRSQSALADIIKSRPLVIDRDNFDEVLSKLNVRLDLDLEGDGKNNLPLHFKELEDFHPDRIFNQVPMFSNLRDLRRRLLTESSFNEAANEVRRLFDENKETLATEVSEKSFESEIYPIESEGLLDNILSQPSGGASAKRSQTTHSDELSRFLSKIVRSHIVQTDENEQARLLNIVDEASSELMRSILHHPRFQNLESAWRGAYLLVRKIETDFDLKIYLLDVCKEELVDNLKSVSSLANSESYQWLVRDTIETPGGEPWSLVCGNFTFDVNVDDIAALIRIAKVAQAANAPFISHLSPEIFGISNLSEAKNYSNWEVEEESGVRKLWQAVRSLPESEYLGLAMPRYLARLPYGADTDTTESFSFEEFREISEHDNYLWSNPAFACALLLAQTYRKNGWEMSQGFQLNLTDLPTHIFKKGGETKTKPCAEILMTEAICQKVLDEGLMPLISYKNSDRVQLGRFQSVALPPKALAGRWS